MPITRNAAASAQPYGKALSIWVVSALLAAAFVAGVDILSTLTAAEGVSAGQALLFAGVALALHLGVGLVVGLGEGFIAGAIAATHPVGPLRRLVDDREFDREATSALLAFLVVAAGYALLVAGLAMRLVAQPERKSVGALLLGGAAAALLPGALLAGYPVHRLTRRIAPLIPRLGRLPRTVLVAGLIVAAIATGATLYVTAKLDWRVLPLALPLTTLGFFAAQAVLVLVTRSRWSGGAAFVGSAIALLAPLVAIAFAHPDERTVALLSIESRATKNLVASARGFFDRDGDGYSTVLGGGDCDDRDPAVHPGARDIPDDGIDQNCLGGDAHRKVEPSTEPASSQPVAEARLRWNGNLLIIAVDTLRADRLGIAGYSRRGGKSLTPNIDALARRSTYFKRVYAQAPNTPRSFPSFFTSRYPSQIEWDNVFQNYSKVQPGNVTLFEVLQAAGIHTAGVASHFYFSDARGITQGFDEFDNEGAKNIKDSNHDTAAPRIVPRAITKMKALSAQSKRWAVFTHLFEPHSTYMEHEEFPIQGKGVEGLEEKYDYEIAYVDKWVGELIAAAPPDTAIVLLSDHGEAFGKHRAGGERMFFHGQTLYDELLRVPLLIALPGQPGRTVDQPVMLLDLAPTLVELVGAPRPPSFVGRSLVPLLAGAALPPAPAHAELLPAPDWKHDAKMMVDGDGKSKLLYRISDNVFELYDLANDPEEQHNLMENENEKELGMRLKRRITTWMESEL